MQILAVRGTLPEHTHTQDEITAAFADVIAQGRLDERVLQRFHRNAGVSQRHLALPLEAYGELSGFTEANDHFISEAVALGSRAVEEALKAADLTPSDVDLVVSATVTGLAIPSLDARIASATGTAYSEVAASVQKASTVKPSTKNIVIVIAIPMSKVAFTPD